MFTVSVEAENRTRGEIDFDADEPLAAESEATSILNESLRSVFLSERVPLELWKAQTMKAGEKTAAVKIRKDLGLPILRVLCIACSFAVSIVKNILSVH
jgi:hypothetical protein